jgi:DNA-directed RNA polymerase subunit N (RpoN/RPB10)
MIVPVRCFSCGKVIADKWRYFEREWERLRREKDASESREYFFDDVACGELLDQLGLTRMCCRRHMLSHVDLSDVI